ncbi:MAG: SUMF1/EgtB/PvdO family nonheme iron enzyme, partial [Polyangiaceae bacterium]
SDGGTDPATVSGFRLDKYLVTVGRFRQYVNYLVGGGTPPANGSGIHAHLNGGLGLSDSSNPGSYETGWDAKDWNSYIPAGPAAASAWNTNLGYGTWTGVPGAQENLPIFASWYAAYAFCSWDGGFLPSEDEWEYAAAGGSQQRYYPWGSTDPGTDNQYAIYGCNYPGGTTCNPNALGLAIANIAPVGTAALGAGLWGQLDLVGNVTQWNLDYWSGVDVASGAAVGTNRALLLTTDRPAVPAAEGVGGSQPRVLRGDDLDPYDTTVVPTWRRDNDDPTTSQGFRCARSP